MNVDDATDHSPIPFPSSPYLYQKLYIAFLINLQIRVEFDPVLLLPAESYLRQWININNEHFPKNGWASVVYSGELNYDLEEFEKLDHMIARLEKATEEEWYIVCK